MSLHLFPLLDDEHNTYAVNAVRQPNHRGNATVVILARLSDDKIVIEEDRTDKQLIDALLQRGVPRERIILAYNGESAPQAIYSIPY